MMLQLNQFIAARRWAMGRNSVVARERRVTRAGPVEPLCVVSQASQEEERRCGVTTTTIIASHRIAVADSSHRRHQHLPFATSVPRNHCSRHPSSSCIIASRLHSQSTPVVARTHRRSTSTTIIAATATIAHNRRRHRHGKRAGAPTRANTHRWHTPWRCRCCSCGSRRR